MDNKSELLDLLKDKKIAIYGAGYVGKTFYKALSICGIAQNVECFIVSQTDPSQKGIYGIKIQSITEFSVSMEGDTLTVSFTANTIYGEIEFKDEAIARPAAA